MRIRGENLLPGSTYVVVSDVGSTAIPARPEVLTTVPDAKWVRVELRRPDARDERREVCDPIVGGQTTLCRDGLLVDALTSPLYVRSAAGCEAPASGR